MLCEFELGRKLRDVPTVDARLANAAFVRVRDGWTLTATFPPLSEGGTFEDDEDGLSTQTGMFCNSFAVELQGSTDCVVDEAIDVAFEALLNLAGDISDTIWVRQQTQGFAGVPPRITRSELSLNGRPHPFELATRHAGGSVFVGLEPPSFADIEAAVTRGDRPRPSTLLLAQATRWGLAEHFSSKSAALLLAASACEVAIKTAVTEDPLGRLGSLAGALNPEGRQAPLSPLALLEHVVPLLLGRSIEADHPGIIGRYKRFSRARDHVAHTGQILTKDQMWPHLNTAREIVGWLEAGGQEPVGHES